MAAGTGAAVHARQSKAVAPADDLHDLVRREKSVPARERGERGPVVPRTWAEGSSWHLRQIKRDVGKNARARFGIR